MIESLWVHKPCSLGREYLIEPKESKDVLANFWILGDLGNQSKRSFERHSSELARVRSSLSSNRAQIWCQSTGNRCWAIPAVWSPSASPTTSNRICRPVWYHALNNGLFHHRPWYSNWTNWTCHWSSGQEQVEARKGLRGGTKIRRRDTIHHRGRSKETSSRLQGCSRESSDCTRLSFPTTERSQTDQQFSS